MAEEIAEGSPVLTLEIPDMVENNAWKNKWLYVRASINYPVSFYSLKEDGLLPGYLLGLPDDPTQTIPLDNKIFAMPGLTLGAEVQFLNWMSIEPNFQLSMGIPADYFYLNMAVGLELKFPIKLFRNFIIEPYGSIKYLLNPSPDFDKFPLFAIGGGI
jgi:hypothetical protein